MTKIEKVNLICNEKSYKYLEARERKLKFFNPRSYDIRLKLSSILNNGLTLRLLLLLLFIFSAIHCIRFCLSVMAIIIFVWLLSWNKDIKQIRKIVSGGIATENFFRNLILSGGNFKTMFC